MTLALSAGDWLSFLPFWLIPYVSFVAVAAMVTQRFRAERDALVRSTPALRFAGVDNQDVGLLKFTGSGAAALAPPMQTHFVRLFVANDPGDQIGANAESVAATITVSDLSGSVLLDGIQGRWASSPQGPELKKLGVDNEGRAITLEANGTKEALDIAMRYEADGECFAWNNDNTRYADPHTRRYAAHRLSGAEFLVDVTVRGSNTKPLRGRFRLRNEGAGKPLKLIGPQ